MNGNKISGAEAIIKSFLSEGVDTVFGYPGGAIIPVYDVLYSYKKELRHILVRHEQAAIHAAQGYARVTGRTGAAARFSAKRRQGGGLPLRGLSGCPRQLSEAA